MVSREEKASVLYLTRNGLLEPLGQSQVMPYLLGLSDRFRITLLSSEKEADLGGAARMATALRSCEHHGIRWFPRKFRAGPKLFAPLLSILGMTWRAWRRVQRDGIRLVHARSYLPAGVAWLVWRLTGTPFIFDMRALWPEEMITAGRLRRGSLVHRVLVGLERICLRDAASVVSLTEAGVKHLRSKYPKELAEQHVVVIPTCADLVRFSPSESQRKSGIVHGCIGTVLSGWFRVDWLKAWFDFVSRRDPSAEFQIITRDDAALIREAVDPVGRLGDRLTIAARNPDQMPGTLRQHDCSVMFYAGGEVSEFGRSPTRMAEVLGCGLPVVANPGVGDVARVIRDHRVGVLVEGPDSEQIEKAMDELNVLMADPELSARCRRAAEAEFSVEEGVRRYRAIYEEVLG